MTILGVVLQGCVAADAAFRQDRRVEFVAPRYREVVELPVTLDWTVADELAAEVADVDHPVAGFAVLLDVSPQPPGEDLTYFARDDDNCNASAGCPDRDYLTRRGVHITRDSELTIETAPPAPGVDLDLGEPDLHEATVILIDEQGHRIGESAWSITFEVARRG